MDEPGKKMGWLEWALIIALAVVAVIAALTLFGPQYVNFYHGPDNLWLHLVGL